MSFSQMLVIDIWEKATTPTTTTKQKQNKLKRLEHKQKDMCPKESNYDLNRSPIFIYIPENQHVP